MEVTEVLGSQKGRFFLFFKKKWDKLESMDGAKFRRMNFRRKWSALS